MFQVAAIQVMNGHTAPTIMIPFCCLFPTDVKGAISHRIPSLQKFTLQLVTWFVMLVIPRYH